MKKTYILSVMILTSVLVFLSSAAGCQRNQPSPSPSDFTLVPTPKPAMPSPPTPGPEVFVNESDTVAIGTVIEGLPPVQQGSSVFGDWVFKVEEYVVKPLPETTLNVRILEQDGGFAVKGVHLKEGEHLLVFLKQVDDHFIFAGGLLGAKFSVDNGKVQNAVEPSAIWELDDVVARIKAVADTWQNETLSSERRAQVVSITLGDPSVKEFLFDKEYDVNNVSPYLAEFVPGEIRYAVDIQSPNQQQWETDLVVIVNATKNKVDKTILNVSSAGFTEADQNETRRIALADETVQKAIGNRGYEVSEIFKDYWQEVRDGKTLFHVFPAVELLLYPRGSENLEVFVDLNQKKVVKIFTEPLLSPNPLKSSATENDFTLNITIPRTEYRVGETAEAIMTLGYNGDSALQLSSPGGEYFDLFIKDTQNNFIYRWRDAKYPAGGLSGLLPLVGETIEPGWSVTGHLQFSVQKAGILYLMGLAFNDEYGYQVNVTYPDGHGDGINIDTPFIVIQAH